MGDDSKRSFIERIILGKNPPKVRKKKRVLVKKPEIQSETETTPYVVSVKDPREIVHQTRNDTHSVRKLSVHDEESVRADRSSIRKDPIPFDENALFVPLRSTLPGRKERGRVLSPEEYFYIGNGLALTSIIDLKAYVESLSEQDWRVFVRDVRPEILLWITSIFPNAKLIQLLELAESKGEATLYLEGFLKNE